MMKHGVTALHCVLLISVIVLQMFLPACSAGESEEVYSQTDSVTGETTEKASSALEPEPETATAEQATVTAATTQAVSQTQPVTEAENERMISDEEDFQFIETTTAGVPVNEAMSKLMDEFGDIVLLCGFEYDEQNDLFYSTLYPLQRYFGYNTAYDLMASRVGMYYNTQKIYFEYGGMDWMLQLWKGQYGITVGAEIGLYNKPGDRLLGHYNSVDDEDMIEMQFDVYKNGEYYFSRGPERHWWLTGFKLLDVAIFLQLSMVVTLYWENTEIADAFEEGLNDFRISDMSYIRTGDTFILSWTI